MKNSTFSAQVANNLLTLLQGYTKGIRFLLVMFLTLTVSAEVWGATLTLNNLGASLTSTSNATISTTTITATGNNTSSYVINYLQCKKQTYSSSHAMLLAKSTGAFISNKTAMPGNIKSVTVYVLTNAASKTTYHCAFSTTECTSAYTTGSTAVNITGGNSNEYTCTVSNAKYFCISLGNTNNGQVYKLDVEYEVDTPPSCTTPPTVSAGSSSNVAATTATVSCSGGITSLGSAGCSIESYGFVYGTSSNPTISNSKVQVGTTYTTTGTAFTKELTGLTANTTYYVRPYATNGNGTAYGTQTSFKTLELPKYTVTLNAGPGTCAASVTETSAGAGVTLPTPTLDCGDWEFAGWKTTSAVTTETTTKPTLIAAGTYKPTDNTTLYAVYERTEDGGSGGGSTEVTFNFGYKDWGKDASFSGTTYSTVEQNKNGVSVTYTRNDGSLYANTTSLRLYKTNTLTFDAGSNTITSITFTGNIGQSDITTNAETCTNSISALSWAGSSKSVTFTRPSNASSYATLTSATLTIGSGSTTYYHSTPDCGGTPVETYTVTFDANGHGTAPAAQTITSGETASEPTEPEETGYTFGGWYSNQQCTGDPFDFSTAITDDITLYAKWTIAEYTIKATLDHCTVAPEIPTTYTYTGSAANLTYTFTPEDGYGLPKTITFSGCEYTWNQSTGVLTLTGVIKSNVTFTIAAKKIHIITWMVNGEQYTTGEPSTTVLNNERVSTLPTNPTLDCSGKTFVGWSDQEVSDGNKPSVLFTSAGTSPQILKNTTFHAVFATLTGSVSGSNTTDVLTHEINGKESDNTTYAAFTDKTYNSNAVYAGNTANGNSAIQLRSDKSTSGIVTTTSGGYAKSITVEWNSNTATERTLDIYGKNEAYADASNLYGNDNTTKGTKLGSIICGTSTELTIDGDYQYIGLRSNAGAMYLNSISIVWSSSAAPTYTGYTTTCTFTAPELDAPTGLTVDEVTCSSVTLSWDEVDGASGYEVVRTLNANNNTYTTTETSYTIGNLEGGKLNSWKVRAIGDGTNYSSSEYTTGKDFTTLFSVKYYDDGVIWHGCDNGCVANGGSFDICEEAPTKANNTFAGWATTADGEVEYQAGETINNIAANVTLHAVWSDVTYTVNWSVNGVDNQVTYTHGQDLVLPTIDIEPCDGMDHVGWTDQLAYRHGTDKLFTEAEGTVTSDATYYAVFATKTSSDGGAETTFDFSTGYTNAETVSSAIQGDITVTFDKGTNSNAPKYYESGEAIRAYGGNTITVSSTKTISKIVITFGTSDGSNAITTDVGTFSTDTWSGETNSIVFTINGSSGNRRIQSIAVTSSGSASYYTDYTTTCGSRQLDTPTNLTTTDITYKSATLTWDEVAGARSYKVVINGTEYNTNTNSYTTHPLKQKTAYTWTVQAIGNGTTFTDSEISAEATFTTAASITITWVAGANKPSSNTIIAGQSIGQALGELPTPETPAGCKEKTFMGWSTTRNIASDGSDFDPITEDIVPTENTTYYAVFAQGDIAGAANITDELTHTINGQESTNTTYVDFSNKSYTSNAVYAGNSCNGTSDVRGVIQLRSNNSTSGIITTASGGSIKSITVEWDSHTADGRTLDIYGKNTAYSAASDLYDDTKKGAILGSIVKGTSTSLTIDGNYQYIGLRSKSGAMYLTSITIEWQSGEVTYTDYSTSCGDFLVTYYGFNTGGYTTICGDNPGEITVPQFDTYTIPTCTPTEDPQGLNRTFAGTWVDDKGNSYKPGDSFEVTDDITLYAQWTWNTNTIPTDESGIADLATTDIVVTGGNTLTLAEGTTTINSLTLKGGLQADSTYAMPIINVPNNATLVRKDSKIHLDLTVNNQSYYPFAVPFEVTNTSENVNYLDTTLKKYANDNKGYGEFYEILEYNGALRAENGVNSAKNWVHVGRHTAQKPSYLVPGKGYAISAVPAKGETTTTIRISMDVDDGWFAGGEKASITVDETTTTRNQIAVSAHTGAAANQHKRHAGWNFVANPYLANFSANENISGAGYLNGKLLIENGNYSYTTDEVPYVTIPTYNFAHYYQVKLSEATLSPAYGFFVQVGTGGTMTFKTAGRQQAPAGLAARNAEERLVKMDVDITLSDNHSSDQTGIIISDRYSDAYEIGRDLEKLFGSAYNLSVYTLMADNTPLAFQALAIRSNMQVIPVGYRAPEQGEYTFALNTNTSSIDLLNEQYEQLVLVDYQTGELTNLLISDYTFYSERTQADNRFAIYAVPRQNAPTDLPNAIGQDKQAQKIIHNGHLYILRDGNVYNGNGQIVK